MSTESQETLLESVLFDNQEYLKCKEDIYQKCQVAFIEEHLPLAPNNNYINNKSYFNSYERIYEIGKSKLNKKSANFKIRQLAFSLVALLCIAWVALIYFKNTQFSFNPEKIEKNSNLKNLLVKNDIKKTDPFEKYMLTSNNSKHSTYFTNDRSINLSKYIIEITSEKSYSITSNNISIESYSITDENLYSTLISGKFGYIKVKDELIVLAQNGKNEHQKFLFK